MIIKDLNTLKLFFQEKYQKGELPPIFGVGVYAFHRLGLEEIIPDYRLLVLRYSLDTALIEKDIETFSLEKGMGTRHIREPRNSTTVLRHPKTHQYLAKFSSPAFLVYKSSSRMEKICQEKGWKILANPSYFGKELFENKIKFRKILENIDVAVPPGKIISLGKLHYGHLINRFGLPFVIQHPTKGGGKGTFFIHNQEDFQKALEKLKPSDENNQEEVIVSQYIAGPSPSILACLTKFGLLMTYPQYQILDRPELYLSEKGNGLFCGHDWTASSFSQKALDQIYSFTQKIGQYFKTQGYRGIFGIDFILDENTEKIYVTECNPRLTGAFPTLTMSQLLNQEPPLLAFHVLEFLNLDYQIDLEKLNQLMQKPKIGSQMLLHNLTEKWAQNHRALKAGIYRLSSRKGKSKLEYLRPGYKLSHLKNPDEFLLAEGVPLKKSHFSPHRRICRILSLNRVLSENLKDLTLWAKEVAQTVYQGFRIKPIRWFKLKKFLFPHRFAKG